MKNYYLLIVKLLNSLHKQYPQHPIGKHIATALDEYPDIWSVTDEIFFNALNDYKNSLSISTSISDIDKILSEGMHLENILEEED